MPPRQASVADDYTFPPEDLAGSLVDHYFQEMNIYFPVLRACYVSPYLAGISHSTSETDRPTFEQCVSYGVHHRNTAFANIFMLVCAIGARSVNDARVFLPGAGTHSAGWSYYNQVDLRRKSPWETPKLWDVQEHCVGYSLQSVYDPNLTRGIHSLQPYFS